MRQFIAREPLFSDGTLRVTGSDFRYLKHVLRLQNGDMLSVRLPSGALVAMTAAQIDSAGRSITLQICADTPNAHFVSEHGAKTETGGTELWLFQFIAKPQKMDLIIRQATECGVQLIVPVIGEYCEKGAINAVLSSRKSERWERVIREALSQCGSAVQTRVEKPMTVTEAAAFWKNASGGIALAMYERDEHTKSLHQALGAENEANRVCLAVGAEGGISPAEIAILSESGFFTIHFETNILRCETAALYGIAAVQSALSERKVWQFKE